MPTADICEFVKMAREELRHPARLLGMSAFWAWLQIVFSSPYLSPLPFLPVNLPSQHLVWTMSLFVTMIMFLLVFAGALRAFVLHVRVIALSSLLMAFGSLMLAVSSSIDGGITFAVLGTIGVGAGSALAFLRWGLHLALLSPRRVLLDMAIFALLTALIFGAFGLLPPVAARFGAVAIPLASGALLHAANCEASQYSASVNDAREDLPRRQERQLLSLAVLVGLVYGIMRGATLSFGASTVGAVTAATVVGVGAAGVLLLVTAVFYRRESELYLVCEVSFPLLAAGFLILPQNTDVGLPLSMIVFAAGHTYFYFLLWVFCVDRAHVSGRDRLSVFTVGLMAFLGSSLVGSLVSDALALMGFEDGSFIGILSLVVVYLFVLAFAVLFRREHMERSRDLRAMSERHYNEFKRCSLLVAKEGCLTERETEVFQLLAEGKDRAAIREQLFISNDTVKTHIRRIYSTLDIHAKQEARSLVERRMEQELRGM